MSSNCPLIDVTSKIGIELLYVVIAFIGSLDSRQQKFATECVAAKWPIVHLNEHTVIHTLQGLLDTCWYILPDRWIDR